MEKAKEPSPFAASGPEQSEDPRSAFKKSCSESEATYHMCGSEFVCETDERGFATPRNRSPFELVLDASEGFIPLWEKNKVLRWCFNENSMKYFKDPAAAKRALRQLLAEAIDKWGDSAPVKFREGASAWDFQIHMNSADNCNSRGACTLASAFFPDGGRHHLRLFPKMLTQCRKEIVDTFIHETGHIFGLRHFFANLTESAWPSEKFGAHKAFSIMNYGQMSELTTDDRNDLKTLYESVWNGSLDNVNGTPIVQFKPFHYAAP